MQQGYGLTETAPMVSFLAPEHALSKVGSSGRPPLFCEVKIVDSSGATVEAYYQRLRAKGKEAKVAIIACMRKLIVILNTMLARDEPWNPQARAAA